MKRVIIRADELPAVRSGERADYKRCVKKWYWAWRLGLVRKQASFGALELGTWVHHALATWYADGGETGLARYGILAHHLDEKAYTDLNQAIDDGTPDYVIDKGEELRALGIEMLSAYQEFYKDDKKIIVMTAEIPLEFSIPDPATGKPMAVHKLKPDLVFANIETGDVWLMEHKTAASIQTGHLVIDDQARPYGAMAERPLRRLGIINKGNQFRGIMYNFLRKALPDTRKTNAQGLYLNKSNGAVSKKQPPPNFVRHPVIMSDRAKRITLFRVQLETQVVTNMTLAVRSGEVKPQWLPKTPHKSCPKTCQFFEMCVAEEEGADTTLMEETLYYQRDPYAYEEESTAETIGFEMG